MMVDKLQDLNLKPCNLNLKLHSIVKDLANYIYLKRVKMA